MLRIEAHLSTCLCLAGDRAGLGFLDVSGDVLFSAT